MPLNYKNSIPFQRKVLNFPEEVYDINDSESRIFKLMFTLLEVGFEPLKTIQDIIDNSESMGETQFSDLDLLCAVFGVKRLPDEMYKYDPYQSQLTQDEWNEIFSKDSKFRMRLTLFFQALLRGGTIEGISMMAECASGIKCQVVEGWRLVNGQGMGGAVGLGRQNPPWAKEFIIIPLEDLEQSQVATIIRMVDLIKPINTISTVHSTASIAAQSVPVAYAHSDSVNSVVVTKVVT